jgi:hypothetical protein
MTHLCVTIYNNWLVYLKLISIKALCDIFVIKVVIYIHKV